MRRFSLDARTCAASVVLFLSGCGASTPHASSESSDETSSRDAHGTDEVSSKPGGADPTTPAVVRVHYPAGQRNLTLEGSSETIALTNVGDDTWEATLGVLNEPKNVRPHLDGTPSRGPEWTAAPGRTLDIYPHFFEDKGKVNTSWRTIQSTHLPMPNDQPRPIEVYFPAGYEENTTARYPVVYMMDGQLVFGNSSESDLLGEMMVDETLDEGNESGAIAEAIVVGIDAPPITFPWGVFTDGLLGVNDMMRDRNRELTPTVAKKDEYGLKAKYTGDGPKFMTMLITEIKPLVDKELRTLPDRDHTYISGTSLGGLMTCYAAIFHGDTFGGALAMSTSAFYDDSYIVRKVQEAKAIGPKQSSRIYANVGGAETNTDGDGLPPMLQTSEDLFAALRGIGYVEGSTLETAVIPDAKHAPSDWSKSFPKAFAFVLGPAR